VAPGAAPPVWEILRCTTCGHGWTFPPLEPQELARRYPASYLGDAGQAVADFLSGRLARTRSWRKETEKVALVERYVAQGAILDVGCGDGRFLWALDASRWNRAGVEPSVETVAQVRARLPGLRLLPGDLFAPELLNSSFDAVTFWHVLEHLPDPRSVLARVRALLRPGGYLFVSLPRLDSLQASVFRRHWYGFDDVPRHVHHFSRASLERLLREAGFDAIRHLFFSRIVNFHCLKHSLLNWSEECFASRVPYYFLKPLLFAIPLVEQVTARYGMLGTVARRADP
jgi:2-polyprenyl-3-methyl-5-hydroxy-6-metoxy-1,4-benzoquinol methylase